MHDGKRKKELDRGSSKTPRSSTRKARSQAGRKDTRLKAQKSRALHKPHDSKASSLSRNAEKAAQVEIAVYEPMRRELLKMIQYLDVLESKKFLDGEHDIQGVLDYLDTLKWQCEIYLKYTQLKESINGN
jgi:hypothetical protein